MKIYCLIARFLIVFNKIRFAQTRSKFDLFWEFLTSGDLPWPRDTFYQNADVKCVILIYNLPHFNEVRNLTLNKPKFVIWPQTQIFYKKLFWDFTDHLELLFVAIDSILNFKKIKQI